jgi:Ras-related C3 botulinum toxin substrate 1
MPPTAYPKLTSQQFLVRATGRSLPLELTFPNDILDNYIVSLNANGRELELALWDTAGQEDFDRLRPLSYGNTDVFLLCFSVVDPVSFINVSDKWLPELRHFQPSTPIILVGTKSDLRKDENAIEALKRRGQVPVSLEQAEAAARKMRAVRYVECSAMTGHNLKLTFDEAVKTVLLGKRRDRNGRQKKCLVM